jgi:cell wall-associated NlpC family hydrolase
VTRRRSLGAALAALVLAGLVVVLGGLGGGGAPAGTGAEEASAGRPASAEQPEDVVLTPDSVDPAAARAAARAAPRSRAQVVELEGAGDEVTYGPEGEHVSPGAPSDDDVRAELRNARAQLTKFKEYLGTTAYLQTGPRARVLPDGTAIAPANSPPSVQRVIQAANAIAKLPYKWGGGHGAWRDNGYDCSGSVSFALAGAGLLEAPLTSGGFMNWAASGPGKWITIYADEGHMFMVVAGLRFDTSGRGRAGTRWQADPRSGAGMSVRHAPGL